MTTGMFTKPTFPKSRFTMSGTEGTGEYVGVAKTSRGAVAVREFSPGMFRIRVEPTTLKAMSVIAKILTRNAGWKQPGDAGQNRFSKMGNAIWLNPILTEAFKALGVGELKTTELDYEKALRHVASRGMVTVKSRVAKEIILKMIIADGKDMPNTVVSNAPVETETSV